MINGKRHTIGISGSYGGLNLGDEAILRATLDEIRRVLGRADIVVFSRHAADTKKRYPFVQAVDVRGLGRREAGEVVRRLDLLLLGGGGILYDADAQLYLRETTFAVDAGIPFMVFAVGAGPLEQPAVRKLVAQRLNQAAAITVRDKQAQKLLEDLDIEQAIEVTADPALLLEPEPVPNEMLAGEGLDGERTRIGFSVREPGPAAPQIDADHYHQLLANAADFMVARYDADIVFVPMEHQHLDVQQSHAVIARMQSANRARVLTGSYTPGQLLSIIERFDLTVGMRLHFLIMSVLQGIPFVALPYAAKVSGFIEDLGIEYLSSERATSGQLIALIDRSWDLRDSICRQIKRQLPVLQDRARRNISIASALLETSSEARHAPTSPPSAN